MKIWFEKLIFLQSFTLRPYKNYTQIESNRPKSWLINKEAKIE